jgi:methylglutaconyl-CoA hydratase
VATQSAQFAFSEVKLGMIPAVISPYVIAAIGARNARRYFVTGERFEAAQAFQMGLVHDLAGDDDDLDEKIGAVIDAMMLAGPVAQREAKELVRAVAHRPMHSEILQDTADRIARIRVSPEGREGVSAFLEKRKASWVPKEPDPAG